MEFEIVHEFKVIETLEDTKELVLSDGDIEEIEYYSTKTEEIVTYHTEFEYRLLNKLPVIKNNLKATCTFCTGLRLLGIGM